MACIQIINATAGCCIYYLNLRPICVNAYYFSLHFLRVSSKNDGLIVCVVFQHQFGVVRSEKSFASLI